MDPYKVDRVLVIGAGVMGHSIAQVYAQAGIEVDLVDLNQELLDYALKKIEFNLEILSELVDVVWFHHRIVDKNLYRWTLLLFAIPYSGASELHRK